MTRTAVLFSSHILDDVVLARFEKLRAEVPVDHDVFFFFDETRLRAARVLRLAGPLALAHGANDWVRYKRAGHYFKEKVPGNEDGFLLSAFHRLSGYDRYWYLEYDVEFSGNWGKFFAAFTDNSADMLGTNITRYDEIPDWPLWKSLELPPDLELPRSRWLRSFNPLLRLSGKAFKTLAAEYQKGWAGHSEAVMPTVLALHGLHIEDFGGDGEFVPPDRENRFYRSNRYDNSLMSGTFVFRPAMPHPGAEPDLLWHPVKVPKHRTWDHSSAWLSARNALHRRLARWWP